MYIRLRDGNMKEVMMKVKFNRETIYLVKKPGHTGCLNVPKEDSNSEILYQSPSFKENMTNEFFHSHYWHYGYEVKEELVYEHNIDAKYLLNRR